ncbi:3-alpha-(or 20-beta)-hydroxysteroid dehydrogenase domain protein [Mycobacterium xenopi 3993]|nr:3-alpha-(or 20-beta)-hydroxysteroid dehydrogenase domain protein [Mycobacterium xenopi 3993]
MGASHARLLVSEGAKVVIGDILDDEGKALADELGRPRVMCTSTLPNPTSGTRRLPRPCRTSANSMFWSTTPASWRWDSSRSSISPSGRRSSTST